MGKQRDFYVAGKVFLADFKAGPFAREVTVAIVNSGNVGVGIIGAQEGGITFDEAGMGAVRKK